MNTRAIKTTNAPVIKAANGTDALPCTWILINTQEAPTPYKPMPNHSARQRADSPRCRCRSRAKVTRRSEEHTSELQSRGHLVCRLLLEKKKIQAEQGI